LLLYTVADVCAVMFVVEKFIRKVKKRPPLCIITLKDYSS